MTIRTIPIRFEAPQMLRIVKVEDEAQNIKSFTFAHALRAKPGQFVMVWFPGLNQKPMSVGACTKDSFTLTIAAVGSCSRAIYALQTGDYLGVQGPYGRAYTIPTKKHIVMVAGGYGAAPLYFATLEALKKKCTVDYIIGARTADLLVYRKKLKALPIKAHIMTDDGSAGKKGFTTHALEALLKKGTVDHVMTCGPEIMQKKVVDLCVEYDVACQVSIERYMKCGFGVCGSCCVDPTGQRTCVEGPVMSKEEALSILEFGKYHRDASGTRHRF